MGNDRIMQAALNDRNDRDKQCMHCLGGCEKEFFSRNGETLHATVSTGNGAKNAGIFWEGGAKFFFPRNGEARRALPLRVHCFSSFFLKIPRFSSSFQIKNGEHGTLH